jgi:hypothetical protein
MLLKWSCIPKAAIIVEKEGVREDSPSNPK